jgi:hypothetical protein
VHAVREEGSSAKRRVLLDTNVWRYVVDCASEGDLLRLARNGSNEIQIAPAVLYETLRLKDIPLRNRIIHLMTNKCFRRLMPEAYSESMEILVEVKRVRPDWLRPSPDLLSFERQRKDWARRTGGFWVRCNRSPDKEARLLGRIEPEMLGSARMQAQNSRKEMMDLGLKQSFRLDQALGSFDRPTLGWRGDMVEFWRLDGLTAMSHSLARPDGAYFDWLSPFVDLNGWLLNSSDWNDFWLYRVEKSALPRQWLRWAHSWSQRFRKVTAGTPGDTQLFTYFLETDLVITADKALVGILEECRPYAPCLLPSGEVIRAGASGVGDLLKLLESPPRAGAE